MATNITKTLKQTLLLLLTPILAACSLGFIPLTPKKVELEPRLVLSPDSQLLRQGNEILLSLTLNRVPEEGFLALYLYKDETKIFEDSKLINPKTTIAEFKFTPARIGSYRALLFWQGNIVRQFDFVLK